MKFISAFVLTASLLWGTFAFAQTTYVHPYFRKDGTYVQGHYRSAPDHNRYNNWSTQGNVNPFTGQEGHRNPYNLGQSRQRSYGYSPSTPSINPWGQTNRSRNSYNNIWGNN